MLRTVTKGLRDSMIKEANVLDAGGILPGHLIDYVSAGNACRQTRVGPVPLSVAIENDFMGPSTGGLSYTGGWSASQVALSSAVNDQVIPATPYSSGDQLIYAVLADGAEFLAWINNGQNISYGQYLESAGDGTLRASPAPGIAASASIPSATSLASGMTVIAKNGGIAGDDISITINAPTGAGAVSVVDDNITVTPAAASTIAQMVTLINGNATAAGLVTASSTDGTGAALAEAVAQTFLSGGLDGGQETARFRALQTYNNTSGVAQQLLVEVIG